MSLNPTLTISIDRTSLGLSALVASAARDANALGIVGYQEPAIQQRIRYAPPSDNEHGSVALSAAYEHTLLGFDVKPDATTEAASRALLAELRAALNQFSYEVTVTVDGATPEVWTCDPGSLGAASRDYTDLANHDPVFPVSIPCHPVRS